MTAATPSDASTSPAGAPAQADHRRRVAALRRERMRQRLVESAVLVFADKGLDACVIDDVIAHAAVARGSFYNHFKRNADLLAAASAQVNDELLQALEARVRPVADPAQRIALGLRLFLDVARRLPLLARFAGRAAADLAVPGNLVMAYLPPHLQAGMALGRFRHQQLDAALDLTRGAVLVGLSRLAHGSLPAGYEVDLVAGILRGLGLADGPARALAARPFEPLQPAPGSLLARCQARLGGLDTASGPAPAGAAAAPQAGDV